MVYFALSGSLIKNFELVNNISSLTYTKQTFFPHVSMESSSYYLSSIIDILHSDKKKPYFNTLIEFHDIFSLVLYKITIKTE